MPKPPVLILDASVVAKWFVQEEDSAKADRLLDAIGQGQWRAAIPSLLRAELAHVLWKKKGQGYDRDMTVYVFEELDKLSLDEVSVEQLFPLALDASYAYDITIYDAFYVALAEAIGGTLVTFDKDLIKKAKRHSTATFLHP